MNFLVSSLVVLVLIAVWRPVAVAQQAPFNCGSTGAYGPMNITANTTLQLPPDGVFHCTTITVAANMTLKFAKNALNTPVYLLATGDVVINGTIDVSGGNNNGVIGGDGGPGGFAGGSAGGRLFGAGLGPGGGAAGSSSRSGGYGSFRVKGGESAGTAAAGAVYGNSLMIPLIGGSGGGGGWVSGFGDRGGGGGGGAILIASNSQVLIGTGATGGLNGTISTSGGGGNSSGSGGAIRIVSPRVSGWLSASHAGTGRFRIDSYDKANIVSMPGGFPPDASGQVMVVFPPTIPKLSIANAAGTAVAENAAAPVIVLLPTGTSQNQTIRVRARDFGGVVPIRVRLTPESGDAITVDAQIDNTVNNPATVDVPVTLPVNVGVNVMVFTR